MSNSSINLYLTDLDGDYVEVTYCRGADYISVSIPGENDVHLDQDAVRELKRFLGENYSALTPKE